MSEWWYASTPKMTVAVEVKDGIVVAGAPIIQRFVGQPAKSLGQWLRKQGDTEFQRIIPFTHTYAWGNNPKRETMKGRRCRIVARGQMRSVMVEFDDGHREIVSIRSLRTLT